MLKVGRGGGAHGRHERCTLRGGQPGLGIAVHRAENRRHASRHHLRIGQRVHAAVAHQRGEDLGDRLFGVQRFAACDGRLRCTELRLQQRVIAFVADHFFHPSVVCCSNYVGALTGADEEALNLASGLFTGGSCSGQSPLRRNSWQCLGPLSGPGACKCQWHVVWPTQPGFAVICRSSCGTSGAAVPFGCRSCRRRAPLAGVENPCGRGTTG